MLFKAKIIIRRWSPDLEEGRRNGGEDGGLRPVVVIWVHSSHMQCSACAWKIKQAKRRIARQAWESLICRSWPCRPRRHCEVKKEREKMREGKRRTPCLYKCIYTLEAADHLRTPYSSKEWVSLCKQWIRRFPTKQKIYAHRLLQSLVYTSNSPLGPFVVSVTSKGENWKVNRSGCMIYCSMKVVHGYTRYCAHKIRYLINKSRRMTRAQSIKSPNIYIHTNFY